MDAEMKHPKPLKKKKKGARKKRTERPVEKRKSQKPGQRQGREIKKKKKSRSAQQNTPSNPVVRQKGKEKNEWANETTENRVASTRQREQRERVTHNPAITEKAETRTEPRVQCKKKGASIKKTATHF